MIAIVLSALKKLIRHSLHGYIIPGQDLNSNSDEHCLTASVVLIALAW